MQSKSEAIYFLSAKRCPFGSFLGSLKNFTATDLGVHAAKNAIDEAQVPVKDIDHVIFGNVLQSSKDAIYLARHIGLRAEVPLESPALTVNRLCGSGFEAIIQGARLLALQEAQVVLVGGTESMSQAPHVIRGARTGLGLGQGQLEDSLWESLNDSYVNVSMGMTAENLALEYKISQEEVDKYSLESQERYFSAKAKHLFYDEIAPIDCGSIKKPHRLEHDEHPREGSSIESMKKLPKVFKPDGVVHAGAASGICDGAAALIMATESYVEKHELKPIGEFINFGISGCNPKIMGIGPVMAIKQSLAKASLDLESMSMIEVNEAFAPQVLAVKKALALDPKRFNVHGGAIALGHPLGASGARITAHLLHSLKKQDRAYGIGSACIGGGQGISVLVRSL